MVQALALGDFVRVRTYCLFDLQAQLSVNNLDYIVGAVGGTPATDQDVADQVDAAVAGPYKDLMTAAATYKGVQVSTLLVTPPYLTRTNPVSATTNAGVGVAAGAPLPGQVSGLISLRTARGGRAGRGRSYIGFPGIVHDTGAGNPTAGYVAFLVALADQITVGLSISAGGRTATLVRVVLHTKNKFEVVPPPDGVTSFVARAKWATQRRRGDFGRLNVSPI